MTNWRGRVFFLFFSSQSLRRRPPTCAKPSVRTIATVRGGRFFFLDAPRVVEYSERPRSNICLSGYVLGQVNHFPPQPRNLLNRAGLVFAQLHTYMPRAKCRWGARYPNYRVSRLFFILFFCSNFLIFLQIEVSVFAEWLRLLPNVSRR